MNYYILYIISMNTISSEPAIVVYKTSEAHRRAQAKYIRKNKDKSNVWSAVYYQKNKARIKLNRKVKYCEKKAAALLLSSEDKIIHKL
jgi:hypothetical protein